MELILCNHSDKVNDTPPHCKLNFILWNAHLDHLAPNSLLEVKKATYQFGFREVNSNLGEESSFKINTNIGRDDVSNGGKPIECLPIAFLGFACHKNPCYWSVCLSPHIKDHNDETLIEGSWDNGECTINIDLNLM